ncbi:MAG: hypothetical protein IIZ49_05985, partial [Oscillospiraceae bacterium]|nr:hypothetical protein [Oscillospiraceae bacterium]
MKNKKGKPRLQGDTGTAFEVKEKIKNKIIIGKYFSLHKITRSSGPASHPRPDGGTRRSDRCG